MRLLHRLWPAVDVAQLRVLAVEGERLFLRPGAHDELVGFAVLVAGDSGDLSVAEVGVHRGADGKTGNQASAGDHVEHREFFGDTYRRVVESNGVADHTDC